MSPSGSQDSEGFSGAIHFMDVRTGALVLAFIALMWLVTGLAEAEDPTRIETANQCIHLLLWQTLAFYLGGFLGEWLPRVALVFFCLVLAVGITRVLLLQGAWLYGPDLLLLFNGAMAWLVWAAAKRFRRAESAGN